MITVQRTHLKILAALVAGGVAVGIGCGDSGGGSDDGNGGTGSNSGSNGGFPVQKAVLQLAFDPMYSGYDGVHDYKLPVKVTGATGDLTVTTDPPDFVDSEPNTDGVMLTMRKAGATTVLIKDAQGSWGSAKLTITQFTPDQWELGKTRYNEGGVAFDFEGGAPMPGTIPDRNDMAACTSCHLPDGAGGSTTTETDGGFPQIDIEHTPQQTGGYTDDQLIAIFTEGKKPAGSPFRVIPSLLGPTIYSMFHKWNVDEDTKQGIVAYLRSLEPKPQGEIDFGALIPRGDGGINFPRPDAGTNGGGGSDAGTSTDAGSSTDAGTTEDAATGGDDAATTGADAGA